MVDKGNMNHSCPDCNTELVHSAVGLLCPGCGAVHQFEKFKSDGAATVEVHRSPLMASTPVSDSSEDVIVQTKPSQPTTKAKPKATKPAPAVRPKPSKPAKYSLKHHMKRLMVPELPAAHVSDYSHDDYIGATAMATSQADGSPKVTDISKRYDETFEPDTTEKVASTAAAAAMVGKMDEPTVHHAAEATGPHHDDWKDDIDDTPSGFALSRSAIMIIAAILLLIAAYLAVFWLGVA